MNQLQVWAPNARSVELVTSDKQSFASPVLLAPATITYRGQDISGYWQTPQGIKSLTRTADPRQRADAATATADDRTHRL